MSTEAQTKRAAKLLFWKGLGYIATGMVLIILALVFSGIAFTSLAQPEVHPARPSAVFFMVLITGTVWGGILVWKGFGLTESSISRRSPEQYGTSYRLAKLIVIVLSKTIFRHHRFRWQRIKANCPE